MNRKLAVTAFSALLIALCVAVPAARADVGNQEMIIRVKHAAVDMPGVVLTPGKYDMKFLDLEHKVVMITTADGQRPVGFFEVFPVSRNHRREKAKLMLSKNGAGAPPRLSEFFYPETRTGYEFIYSRRALLANGVR
jgi:hypothetical protein